MEAFLMPTDRQRQTLAARQAFANRFTSPEEREAYYRNLGQRSAEGRIILTGEQADALRQAYAFLRTIAPKLETTAQPDQAA
jgi:hypothetical protein